jgi:serine/threonine protein phosphatase PrpC
MAATRAVLCRNGAAVFVTKDHKPAQPEEVARIESAGGFVASNRVCHCLAVSRAFGDFEFKDAALPPAQCMVSCVPVRLCVRVSVCLCVCVFGLFSA